jgi:hypothetical protein
MDQDEIYLRWQKYFHLIEVQEGRPLLVLVKPQVITQQIQVGLS